MIGQRRLSVDDWQEVLQCDCRLVTIEQTEPREMLTKLTLDSNLNEITFKQHAVVLAYEPETTTSATTTTTTALTTSP